MRKPLCNPRAQNGVTVFMDLNGGGQRERLGPPPGLGLWGLGLGGSGVSRVAHRRSALVRPSSKVATVGCCWDLSPGTSRVARVSPKPRALSQSRDPPALHDLTPDSDGMSSHRHPSSTRRKLGRRGRFEDIARQSIADLKKGKKTPPRGSGKAIGSGLSSRGSRPSSESPSINDGTAVGEADRRVDTEV
jgi:hypothetical protein